MFSNNLKKARESCKMSQEVLAKKLFVSRTAVTGWETGRTSPPPETIAKIADILQVSTDYLLGKSDIPTPPQIDYTPLQIPEILKDVKVAAHGGDSDWTQEEVNEIANFVEFIKSKKRA